MPASLFALTLIVQAAAGQPPVGTLCLTNACDDAAPAAPATAAAPPVGPQQLIGADPIPAREPFALRFDGNRPIRINGRIIESRFPRGMAAEFIVEGDDGKRYRVFGGSADFVSRSSDLFPAGSQVVVRGYPAYDQSCLAGGCAVNARDFTLANGDKVIIPPAVPVP